MDLSKIEELTAEVDRLKDFEAALFEFLVWNRDAKDDAMVSRWRWVQRFERAVNRSDKMLQRLADSALASIGGGKGAE